MSLLSHLHYMLHQFSLLYVTVQTQLEEMHPESQSDGGDGEVGKVPSVIHTALTCCRCVSASPDCANTPNSQSKPSDLTRHTSRHG